MMSLSRTVSRAATVGFLAASLVACGTPANPSNVLALDTPAEYTGTVVGPTQRGQPEEGTGFKSFELELPAPIAFDDRADCGPQTVARLPIEEEGMAQYLGKTVRLTATAYCRTSRTGTYHLKNVTVR